MQKSSGIPSASLGKISCRKTVALSITIAVFSTSPPLVLYQECKMTYFIIPTVPQKTITISLMIVINFIIGYSIIYHF